MAYCALSDLERRLTRDRLIELTDDAVPPSSVDTDVLDAEIAGAGEVVDGYLRDRYVLPLDPVPGLVREITADLVAYRLWTRRPDANANGEAPKNLERGYDTALRLLREIQAGKVTLGVAAGQPDPAPHASSVRVNTRHREFGEDTLESF